MSSSECEMFVPINLFEMFDGKSPEQAIDALNLFVAQAQSVNCEFRVVKSEIGLGVLMYLAVQESVDDAAALKKRREFFAEKSRKLIEDNRTEWDNLKDQFIK